MKDQPKKKKEARKERKQKAEEDPMKKSTMQTDHQE